MKVFLPGLLSFILSVTIAMGQTPSSCVPSSLLAGTYSNDVKDLAFSRMYAIHSPDTARISIPAIHQDSILAGLAAICNTGTLL